MAPVAHTKDGDDLHRPTSLTTAPRFSLCHLPTPLEPLARLSAHLGGPSIFIKRDDATGLMLGGNKARKLEFIVGDALAKGATRLLTGAGVQSNHARQTAAAAARAGLSVELVLARMVPWDDPAYERTGNILLDRLLGARLHIVPKSTDTPALLTELAERARGEGEVPYIVPFGGSEPPGSFGYFDAAFELLDQAAAADLEIAAVFHGSGSAGTQAGLVAGMAAAGGRAVPIEGISVLSKDASFRDRVLELSVATARALGTRLPDEEDVRLDLGQVGEAYGLPTEAMVEAVLLTAQLEGILLDPVYTGKAMAGLIAAIRTGRYRKGSIVVFWHTGGAPGLFAYERAFEAVPHERLISLGNGERK